MVSRCVQLAVRKAFSRHMAKSFHEHSSEQCADHDRAQALQVAHRVEVVASSIVT